MSSYVILAYRHIISNFAGLNKTCTFYILEAEACLTCDQAFFFRRSAKEKQRETRWSVGGQSGEKKSMPDTFTARVVCRQSRAESGLLSDWSKNKRVFDRFVEPHSHWLHDCMFDFRCNFKTRSGYGDRRGRCERRIFRCSYYVS